MVLSGLHAYIILVLKNKIPYKKWFFPSLLLGSVIPDIDFFFANIHKILTIPSYLYIINKTFGHSLITVIIAYILLMITYEIKKRRKFLYIANGIISGMILHIACDLIILNNKIDLFWPLPIDANTAYKQIIFSKSILIALFTSEFIFFRLFSWNTINTILEQPFQDKKIIKIISKWMKIQLYFTIIFFISSFFINTYYIFIFFLFGYVPSLIIMFYTIYNTWDNLDYYDNENYNKIDSYYKERENLINID